ncbi:MAG: cobyric acid synthase, partial [Planctomycetota bacterium]
GRTLMVMGTGSGVGKSLLTAALCRIFTQEGLSVAPYKSQNMSNNAHVCADGGEISRAQALQAAACRLEPTVDMNPILLKPGSDTGAQVIVRGRPLRSMKAKEYQDYRHHLIPQLKECLTRLRQEHDLVVIEGAGSPAEINLRDTDIVNMKTAEIAGAPVILVGDIDFGGVFAQLVGTMELLTAEERKRVKGLVINKFRGDLDILKPGIEFLEQKTGLPVLGVVPFLKGLQLPEEDTPAPFTSKAAGERIRIDVVRLPRMANFTDFDALGREHDVELRYVERPDDRVPDALIIPGTKSTMADLRHLKENGLASHIISLSQRNIPVVGICGGYQILGRRVLDPQGVESDRREEEGLGLLPCKTTFSPKKETAQVTAVHVETGEPIEGYEIHMGRTEVEGDGIFHIKTRAGVFDGHPDGASAGEGRIWGTYIHGVFDARGFRRHFINQLRSARGWAPDRGSEDTDLHAELDKLALHVRSSLDMKTIRRFVETC